MSGTSFFCLLDLGLGPLRPSCLPRCEACDVSPEPVGFSEDCVDFWEGSNGGCGPCGGRGLERLGIPVDPVKALKNSNFLVRLILSTTDLPTFVMVSLLTDLTDFRDISNDSVAF